MTVIDDTAVNKNFLSQLGFMFTVRKMPRVSFTVQRVTLPGLSITPTQYPNPLVSIPLSGDHISFEELALTFIVEEELTNYFEMYNWINGLGFPETPDQYKDLTNQPSSLGVESDIVLSITNNIKNVKFQATFRDAFPLSLSSLEFNTTDDDVSYLTATATFRYTLYTFEKL